MSEFFRLLLSLSFSGSVLFLALLACKPLCRRRLSQGWQYCVWLVVVVRLLIPVSLPLNMTAALTNIRTPPAVTATGPAQRPGPQAREVTEWDEPAAAPRPLDEYLAPLWASVALGLLVHKAAESRGYIRLMRAGAKPLGDEALLKSCAAAHDAVGIRRRIPVYVNPMASAPMMMGLVHPFIIIPQETMDPERGYHVFLHELCHRKRLHNAWNWAAQLAVYIHWFNPLVYLLRREIGRSRELCCDEAVLALIGGQRRAYGDTLLSLASAGYSVSGASSISGGAKIMKERLGAIMRFHEQTRGQKWAAFFCGCLVAAAALVCGCATLRPQARAITGGPLAGSNKALFSDDWSTRDLHITGKFFTCNAFFEDGYIVELGWNVDSSKYGVTKALPAKNPCTLAFLENTKQYAGDWRILDAVKKAVDEAGQVWYEGKAPASPVLMGVAGPFQESAAQLADRFYANKDLLAFGAVIRKLDDAAAGKLSRQAYADGRVAEFSIVMDSLSQSDRTELAKQAYKDGKVDFFSILSDKLTGSEKAEMAVDAVKDNKPDMLYSLSDSMDDAAAAEFAKQAYCDEKISIFYAVMDALSEKERSALAKQSYKDDKIEFFYALYDALSSRDMEALAKQAYKDDKIAFFYSLSDALGDRERAALAKQAYEDNRISFFYELADALTEAERKELAKRVYEDNRVEFFYALSGDFD